MCRIFYAVLFQTLDASRTIPIVTLSSPVFFLFHKIIIFLRFISTMLQFSYKLLLFIKCSFSHITKNTIPHYKQTSGYSVSMQITEKKKSINQLKRPLQMHGLLTADVKTAIKHKAMTKSHRLRYIITKKKHSTCAICLRLPSSY